MSRTATPGASKSRALKTGVSKTGVSLPGLEQFRRLPPPVVDALIVVAVAVPTAMDARWNETGSRQADGWTYAFTAVSVLALFVRRRWPIGAALVSGGGLTGLYVLGHHGELLNLPVMVALYTLAVSYDRRTTVITGVIAAAWSGVLGFTSTDPLGARGGSPVLEMLVPLVPLALGEAVRSGRELLAHAQAEREREAARRVAEERQTMAREFHDVVAHTISAVNVQMAAAVAAFDVDPEAARGALLQARDETRRAVQELRATVALLRQDDGTDPAPRLDDVERLAGPARSAGIDVRIVDERGGLELSGATELAAYRIVQESLTNVVRHSGATSVTVTLHCDDGRLVVEVVDDGTGGNPSAEAGGFGLRGMGERAGAVGGRVEHGRLSLGGFRVRAELPGTVLPRTGTTGMSSR